MLILHATSMLNLASIKQFTPICHLPTQWQITLQHYLFTLAKRVNLKTPNMKDIQKNDRFLVYVRDFVKEPNGVDDPIMIHEFESTELNDIRYCYPLLVKTSITSHRRWLSSFKIGTRENAYEDLSTSDSDSDHPFWLLDSLIHLQRSIAT